MTTEPSQTSISPDDSSSKIELEINRLLTLGYPRDMLHVMPDGAVVVYKDQECDDILEMWKEINKVP